MSVSLRMRARSSALLPASCMPKSRASVPNVKVGLFYNTGESVTSSDSVNHTSTSLNNTNETTTTTEVAPSALAQKLPLYAFYIVVAGVIYYVGYKIIKAVF